MLIFCDIIKSNAKEQLEKIVDALKLLTPEIKLAYFSGLKREGMEGQLSDYDFAFYVGEKNKEKAFLKSSFFWDKISRLLGTDKIDVVILDMAESPELKYSIIKKENLFTRKRAVQGFWPNP